MEYQSFYISFSTYLTNINLFKVNNRNTRKRREISRKRCEISSNLIINTPERRHCEVGR